MDNKITPKSINPFDLIQEQISELKELILKQQPQTTQAPEEVLLTRVEACKKLNINLVTLRKHSKSGAIPSYAIGNRILYKQSEVMACLTAFQK
jgi:excisionase family DNA binding protein